MRLSKTFVIVGLALFALTNTAVAQDWAGLNRYWLANQKLEEPAPGQLRVVFMGNSITDMWDDSDASFFQENPYINRGISGQTTPQMLVRFRADVIQLNPDVVVILAGTNDIAGNTGRATLGMIENNLASMAELAETHNIEVVLCSVLPVYRYPWSPRIKPAEKIVQLNQWMKQYAQKNGYTYCDYYSALVNDKGGMREAYSNDGVHPTPAGYEVMEPIVKEAIQRALAHE